MRLKVLCCEVFYREVCRLLAASPNTTDVEFLPRGLHNLGTERMVARLQERIDSAQDGEYDAICLIYGLCNNGVIGLSSRTTRLVIPRVHDCIALFLGSHGKYQQYFDAHPGTYYRTTGWYERMDASGAGEDGVMEKLGITFQRQKLVEQYGEENADYILETMGSPTQHYDRITFISMGLPCEPEFEQMARDEAEEKGWNFDKLEGSMELMSKCIDGEWDDRFLVLDPGQAIQPSHDGCIMCSAAEVTV